MVRLLNESGRIANAIRENGTIAMPGMFDEVDPQGPPLSLRGLNELFTGAKAGTPFNIAFAYAGGGSLETIDPGAQVDVQRLIADILELNCYCQQAVFDDALGVALQAPKLPDLVDRIVAGTAYFAAFFEAVAIARPAFAAKPARAVSAADMARVAEVYSRYQLMASDRMLAPEAVATVMPGGAAARIGIETTWAPHAGEQFINGVYFPAGQADSVQAAA